MMASLAATDDVSDASVFKINELYQLSEKVNEQFKTEQDATGQLKNRVAMISDNVANNRKILGHIQVDMELKSKTIESHSDRDF